MYISRSFLILPCQVSFMMQSQIPYDFARILWRLFSFSCRSLAALICILHYKSNQPKNKLREKKQLLIRHSRVWPSKVFRLHYFRCQKEAAAVAMQTTTMMASRPKLKNSHSKTALSMYDGLQQ